MSELIKSHPLVEENSSKSSEKNKKKEKDKQLPLIRQSNTDKNDITIELSTKKKYDNEDDKSNNSAEFSSQEIKNENKNSSFKAGSKSKPIVLPQKAYEKYTQRLKERTMRMELEKIDKETERLKQKFEERNSFSHLLDNNPQFKKMLKFVKKQLILILILGVFICGYSGFVYFYITESEEGIVLASLIVSIAELSMFLILIISLKIGILNDPYLSKAFRLFVIIELLLILACFVLNIIIPIILKINMEVIINQKVEIIIYLIFGIIGVLHIIIFKCCYPLFKESILILLNKKTEYSILIVNEQTHADSNMLGNISTSINYSSDNLNNNTTTGILSENEKNYNSTQAKKEEEQFRNFNYFNKFHYSVTSDRKEDKYFK